MLCPAQDTQIYGRTGNRICAGEECEFVNNQMARTASRTISNLTTFFWECFQFCGIDNRGGIAPVQLGWSQDNAAWICESENCLWKFNTHYVIPDVIAHEYTHAVVDHV